MSQHPASSLDDSFMTRAEVADLLKISAQTLLDWQAKGFGPPATKVSPRVTLYSRRALAEFIQSRT